MILKCHNSSLENETKKFLAFAHPFDTILITAHSHSPYATPLGACDDISGYRIRCTRYGTYSHRSDSPLLFRDSASYFWGCIWCYYRYGDIYPSGCSPYRQSPPRNRMSSVSIRIFCISRQYCSISCIYTRNSFSDPWWIGCEWTNAADSLYTHIHLYFWVPPLYFLSSLHLSDRAGVYI